MYWFIPFGDCAMYFEHGVFRCWTLKTFQPWNVGSRPRLGSPYLTASAPYLFARPKKTRTLDSGSVKGDTVDGRNPANQLIGFDRYFIPPFTRFYASQVVQDFFHQQYEQCFKMLVINPRAVFSLHWYRKDMSQEFAWNLLNFIVCRKMANCRLCNLCGLDMIWHDISIHLNNLRTFDHFLYFSNIFDINHIVIFYCHMYRLAASFEEWPRPSVEC